MAQKTVYALVDPRDSSVRYVGASANPVRRFRQHLDRAKQQERHEIQDPTNSRHRVHGKVGYEDHVALELWIRSLTDQGLKPDLRLLSDPSEDWREIERQEQARYNLSLHNHNDYQSYYYSNDLVRELIGDQLAEARKEQGISRTEAANRLFTTPATISRWESGDRTPSLRQVFHIAQAYGVPARSLIPEISQSKGAANDVRKAKGGAHGADKDQEED